MNLRFGKAPAAYAAGTPSVVAETNSYGITTYNTDLNYSIKSYLPEGDEAENTAEVYVTDRMDPDDFIYTTDKAFYDQIKAKDINVILQDNKRFVNDGSLSVYCGLNGIRYLNIEAQKGHFDEQLQLIKEVMSIL